MHAGLYYNMRAEQVHTGIGNSTVRDVPTAKPYCTMYTLFFLHLMNSACIIVQMAPQLALFHDLHDQKHHCQAKMDGRFERTSAGASCGPDDVLEMEKHSWFPGCMIFPASNSHT